MLTYKRGYYLDNTHIQQFASKKRLINIFRKNTRIKETNMAEDLQRQMDAQRFGHHEMHGGEKASKTDSKFGMFKTMFKICGETLVCRTTSSALCT